MFSIQVLIVLYIIVLSTIFVRLGLVFLQISLSHFVLIWIINMSIIGF